MTAVTSSIVPPALHGSSQTLSVTAARTLAGGPASHQAVAVATAPYAAAGWVVPGAAIVLVLVAAGLGIWLTRRRRQGLAEFGLDRGHVAADTEDCDMAWLDSLDDYPWAGPGSRPALHPDHPSAPLPRVRDEDDWRVRPAIPAARAGRPPADSRDRQASRTKDGRDPLQWWPTPDPEAGTPRPTRAAGPARRTREAGSTRASAPAYRDQDPDRSRRPRPTAPAPPKPAAAAPPRLAAPTRPAQPPAPDRPLIIARQAMPPEPEQPGVRITESLEIHHDEILRLAEYDTATPLDLHRRRDAADVSQADSLKLASRVLSEADQQAAAIRTAALQKAARVRQLAIEDAAALREAADRDAAKMRAAVMKRWTDLNEVAAYVTENLAGSSAPDPDTPPESPSS